MEENKIITLRQPGEVADPLTEVLRNGARALLAQAVEPEVAVDAVLDDEEAVLPDEGEQALAGTRQPDFEVAAQWDRIERVQGPAEIDGQVVGDIDEGRDRPQAHRYQALLQPFGALPVAHAANRLRLSGWSHLAAR